MGERALTPKQTRFIKEAIKTGNATESAIKAGYSKKSARQIGSENLSKPYIKEKIEEVMSKEAEEIGLNAKKILMVLNRIIDKIDEDDNKILNPIIKAAELVGKNLNMWNDDKIDLTVQHKDVIAQLEELE